MGATVSHYLHFVAPDLFNQANQIAHVFFLPVPAICLYKDSVIVSHRFTVEINEFEKKDEENMEKRLNAFLEHCPRDASCSST